LVGSFDWSGTDQSGRAVFRSCQKEHSDWLGERSVLIGREPTNPDAEFFVAVKQRVLIGREPTNQDTELVRHRLHSLTRNTSKLSNAAFLLVGERSVLIGREPTNQDTEFLAAVKRSLPIGLETACQCVPVGLDNGAI